MKPEGVVMAVLASELTLPQIHSPGGPTTITLNSPTTRRGSNGLEVYDVRLF